MPLSRTVFFENDVLWSRLVSGFVKWYVFSTFSLSSYFLPVQIGLEHDFALKWLFQIDYVSGKSIVLRWMSIEFSLIMVYSCWQVQRGRINNTHQLARKWLAIDHKSVQNFDFQWSQSFAPFRMRIGVMVTILCYEFVPCGPCLTGMSAKFSLKFQLDVWFFNFFVLSILDLCSAASSRLILLQSVDSFLHSGCR